MSTEALIDILWILLCAGFVFLMQGGFLCLESGITRSKNSINVAFKNIVDFGLAVILYWILSYGLMFGESVGGWFGKSGWFFTVEGEAAPFQYSVFIFQAMFCATGATIISGATAERLRFYAYLVITAVFSIVVYPFVGHWVWATDFLGEPSGWLARRGFLDFAGSSVVHSTGGWVSLALLILVGPRAGRFDENGKVVNIPGSNMPLAMLGTTILVFGWFGFNGGSTLSFTEAVPLILMNTLLGAVAGMAVVLAMIPFMKGLPDPGLVMNGAIAGLVSVTANCNLTGPVAAVIIGLIGGAIMIATVRLLEYLKIDDAVGAIPAHLTPGIWGTLAVAFFADPAIMGLESVNRVALFETQFIGVVVIGFWSFVLAFVIFWLINKKMAFRVTAEEEHVGLNISEHGARTETLFLLEDMIHHERTGDLSRRVRVEPFTEVGQIARQYNKVIDTLDLTMSRLKSIFHDLNDGIITFTREGNILSMNPAASRFYGLEPATAGGFSAWDLLVPEARQDLEVHQPADQEPFDPFRAGVLQEIHYYRPNSRKDEVIEFVASMGTFKEDVIYTGLIRDISDTVQARRSTSRLKSKLFGAQQSNFFAMMCRQSLPTIKNLAGRIQKSTLPAVGLLSGAKDEPDSDMPSAGILQLSSDAREIMQVTDDLLHVDQEGALPVEATDIAEFMESFMESTADYGHPEFESTRWELQFDPGPLKALMSPTALPQVLESLLLLACRECKPDGTVTLTSKARHFDHAYTGTEVVPSGDYQVISIHDGGEGVTEEELDHFYEGRDRKYQDIELATSEAMLRHMGGILDVDTLMGFGTTLSIYLPVDRKVKDPGTPESPLGTVLVVEDKRDQAKWLTGTLHQGGCNVLTAETGEKALEHLKAHDVNVVVLDLVLSKDTQPRDFVFREIRAAYPDLPILVTCGEVDSHILASVVQAGAAGFIEKPIRSGTLLHLIKREVMLTAP
ncbi:MAG: ammonium transporter [Kiritimatiellae bacterium]|jgi:ammonium transporter|nr:ammonium transporter [Kiritimatiellia bacterium]